MKVYVYGSAHIHIIAITMTRLSNGSTMLTLFHAIPSALPHFMLCLRQAMRTLLLMEGLESSPIGYLTTMNEFPQVSGMPQDEVLPALPLGFFRDAQGRPIIKMPADATISQAQFRNDLEASKSETNDLEMSRDCQEDEIMEDCSEKENLDCEEKEQEEKREQEEEKTQSRQTGFSISTPASLLQVSPSISSLPSPPLPPSSSSASSVSSSASSGKKPRIREQKTEEIRSKIFERNEKKSIKAMKIVRISGPPATAKASSEHVSKSDHLPPQTSQPSLASSPPPSLSSHLPPLVGSSSSGSSEEEEEEKDVLVKPRWRVGLGESLQPLIDDIDQLQPVPQMTVQRDSHANLPYYSLVFSAEGSSWHLAWRHLLRLMVSPLIDWARLLVALQLVQLGPSMIQLILWHQPLRPSQITPHLVMRELRLELTPFDLSYLTIEHIVTK